MAFKHKNGASLASKELIVPHCAGWRRKYSSGLAKCAYVWLWGWSEGLRHFTGPVHVSHHYIWESPPDRLVPGQLTLQECCEVCQCQENGTNGFRPAGKWTVEPQQYKPSVRASSKQL